MFGEFPVSYRPAVVILNMHYTGLGVARALRGIEAEVWGLSFDDSFIGNSTRYCRFASYPDPARDPAAALEFFREFARRFEHRPLIIPTRDLDLQFLLAHRSELESCYLIPLAPTDPMERIIEKSRLVAVAGRLGIAVPEEIRVSRWEELAAAWRRIGGPCIVKPAVASQWRAGEMLQAVRGQKVVQCASLAELEQFYRRIVRLDPVVLVQEFIPGSDEDLLIFGSYVNARRGITRYFTARKIIQAPPQSGTGIVVEALPVPEIVDPSLRLLKELEFAGISEIEYKLDRRSGRHVLIEINPRHWDQHALGLACGVNLTRALYQDLTGDPVDEMTQSASRVSWIGEAGYLIGLRGALRGTNYPLRQYLRPLFRRKTWATLSLRDPRPGMRLMRAVLRDYAGSAGRVFSRKPEGRE